MKGVVTQFGTKGYGFITGYDNKKYFVHKENIYNKAPLKINTHVAFKVETSKKGLVAVDVKLENSSFKIKLTKKLSDTTIKVMFLSLLVIQIIIIYFAFVR